MTTPVSPPAHPQTARTATGSSTPSVPSAAERIRGAVVVAAGPLLLDMLEVLGPLSALGRWPQRIPPGRLSTAGRWLTLAGVLAPVVDHGIIRPWLRRWGSTADEWSRRLPGDADGRPLFSTTRAVTVHAPVEEVWSWLVQIGQDRGGFYSYDWLENLAGCQLRSAVDIHEEWQHRSAGDPLRIAPGFATALAEVDPPYALVIENWGAYVIEPLDDSTCRLIARSHAERDVRGLVYLLLVELPHAIMERKMLLGIKQRAERSDRLDDR